MIEGQKNTDMASFDGHISTNIGPNYSNYSAFETPHYKEKQYANMCDGEIQILMLFIVHTTIFKNYSELRKCQKVRHHISIKTADKGLSLKTKNDFIYFKNLVCLVLSFLEVLAPIL